MYFGAIKRVHRFNCLGASQTIFSRIYQLNWSLNTRAKRLVNFPEDRGFIPESASNQQFLNCHFVVTW
jgi:hypothetical protein